MYCRNCGSQLEENQKFCKNCGTQRLENTPAVETNQNNEAPVLDTNPTPQVNTNVNEINNTQPVNNEVPNTSNTQINNQNQPKKKKFNPLIIVFIVIGVIVVLILLVVFFFSFIFGIISDSSNKLECKSNEGNITIMYNEEQILGYVSSDMTYDLDQQKEYAKQVGVDAYLEEFTDWFEKNTTGTCTKVGTQGSSTTHDNEKTETSNTTTSTEDGKVIGDKKYGYITVPNNWVEFKDVDGNTALQYSYAGVYIVTMDYIREDTTHTAKEYAQSFLYQKKNDSNVSGATGATVKIGKNKEYTAYQVYMYYPSDGTYLVTYWFESEDGVIRYLALEGPTELSGTKITDYLHIPESFSLNK